MTKSILNIIMTKSILTLLVFFTALNANSQVWFAKNAYVRFFSTTPIEDIEGINKFAAGALNTTTGKIYFKAMMKSFKFEKALMEEHFNENYVESNKYPSAEFEGSFVDMPNLSVAGTYVVKVKGKITMHGVSQERDFMVNLKVTADKIIATSTFKIKCIDFNIKIPKVVQKNIQEDVDVSLNAQFVPKKI
jgi:hypothetical protein